MDPVTLNLALQLGATALNIAQQYHAGAITQEQAIERLREAGNLVHKGIDDFNRAAGVAALPPAAPAAAPAPKA